MLVPLGVIEPPLPAVAVMVYELADDEMKFATNVPSAPTVGIWYVEAVPTLELLTTTLPIW